MTQFSGFPVKSSFTPVPNAFFSSVLPEITDIAELKVTLFVFEILYAKKGYPKFVTQSELLNNVSLLKSLRNYGDSPEISLEKALNAAVERGVLVAVDTSPSLASSVTEPRSLSLSKGTEVTKRTGETLYFINSEANGKVIERIRTGELELPGLRPALHTPSLPEEQPNIFALYEQNIGMLTPLIADELRDAEKNYPAEWLAEAFKEAVKANKRSWRYVSRILERWSTEGKKDGTHQRYIKENTDPDKYVKGKYGHIVQR